jgi:hypothetical protein
LFGINGYEQGNIKNTGGFFPQTEVKDVLTFLFSVNFNKSIIMRRTDIQSHKHMQQERTRKTQELSSHFLLLHEPGEFSRLMELV